MKLGNPHMHQLQQPTIINTSIQPQKTKLNSYNYILISKTFEFNHPAILRKETDKGGWGVVSLPFEEDEVGMLCFAICGERREREKWWLMGKYKKRETEGWDFEFWWIKSLMGFGFRVLGINYGSPEIANPLVFVFLWTLRLEVQFLFVKPLYFY